MANHKKTCFVISPIGQEGSPIRQQVDLVFKHVIEPAVKKTGYYNEPIRADYDPNPSIITTTVIQHILNDDLVVAVLTGKNPNVFYELAIRHAIIKPCVHIIEESSWPPPFDVSGMNIIRYDLSDWGSPEKATSELLASIKSSEESKIISNPISSAIAVQKSILSDNPDTKNTAIMTGQIQQMLNEMRQISSSISRIYNSIRINTNYIDPYNMIDTKPYNLSQDMLLNPTPSSSPSLSVSFSPSPSPSLGIGSDFNSGQIGRVDDVTLKGGK